MMLKINFKDKCNRLIQSGYSLEEESKIYEKQLQDILCNLRWYLDNCEKLVVYRVRWKDYRNKTATLPYAFVQKQKGL